MNDHYHPITIDGHSDILIDTLNQAFTGNPDRLAQVHVPKMVAGNVHVAFTPVSVDNPSGVSHESLDVIRNIDRVRQLALRTEHVEIVTTADEIEAVIRNKHIGLFLGLEGLKPAAGDPGLIRIFHQLGIRWAGLTWNDANEVAQGVAVANAPGLTSQGRAIVREMQQVGMLVDLTHVHRVGFFDAVDLASKPMIVSHSNPNGIHPHARNLSDEQLDAIKQLNGTVGVNFFPKMVANEGPTIEDVADHVDYLVEYMGIDHVSLGPDFIDYATDQIGAGLAASGIDYGSDYTYPAGLENTTKVPRLFAALQERGYSAEACDKIARENLIRVIREATQTSN